MAKALVLLSGGLDSILAAVTLKRQGIGVTALSFESYFFNSNDAKKAAKVLKIPLRTVDLSRDQLAVVKKPKHGYGKNINPCIDCHILMLKKAKAIMKKEKFDFVATGEVLGERPMSQNRKSLDLIEKEAGLKGYLLRPLSAQLLPETVPEKKGLIDRKKFFDIVGRSRKKQIALAKLWKIKSYPSPAGGCLLTDINFSKRLKELLSVCPKPQANDLDLLRLGRHFVFGRTKIVLGRNKQENRTIEKAKKKGDILIEMVIYPGPTALIRPYSSRKINPQEIQKAERLVQSYAAKARDEKDVKFRIK
jgi:tRNA U34 2-thiouridine synthase MnmA/TrmU